MTQSNLHQLAREGHPQAISALLNQHLKTLGVRSKVGIKSGCLHVILEADDEIPDRPSCLEVVRVKVINWDIDGIERVRVYGRQSGSNVAVWQQEFAVAVGGYSNFLFSQSRGTTNAPETDKKPLPPQKPQPKPDRSSNQLQRWAVWIVLASIVLGLGAYFLLQQPTSEDSPSEASQMGISRLARR